MKRILITITILFIFFSCSKEKEGVLCLKIKVIGYNHCSPAMMGVQIMEGPQIGEVYGNYSNVISIYYTSPARLSPDSILYVRVRNKNRKDNFDGVCLEIYPNPVFSTVTKIPLSFSRLPCN